VNRTIARVVAITATLLAAPLNASEPKATSGQVKDQAAAFLLTSMEVKNKLETGDAETKRLAPDFWQLTSSFASLAMQSGEDAPLYEPLFTAFESAMDHDVLRPSTPDLAALRRLTNSLAEQVKIGSGWGAFPGQRHSLTVEVRAWDSQHTREIKGLYVWLDLICCVRADRSSKPFLSTTSPAIDRVIPGTYLVRLLKGDKVVAKREVSVGLDYATTAPVDVVVQ